MMLSWAGLLRQDHCEAQGQLEIITGKGNSVEHVAMWNGLSYLLGYSISVLCYML